MHNRIPRIKNTILLGIILLTGLGLRLCGLQWGLPGQSRYSHASSFHPDEQSYFYALRQLSWTKRQFYPTESNILVKGTLQMYLLGASIAVASPWLVLSRDAQTYRKYPKELGRLYLVGRCMSVFQSLASVLLIFWIGSYLWGKSAGFFASAIYSFLPVHVINAHYISTDSAFSLYLLALFALCLKVQQERNVRLYLFAGLVWGLMTANKYNAAPAGMILLAAHWMSEDARPNSWLGLSFIAALFGYVLGCPIVILDPAFFTKAVVHSLSANTLSHGYFGDGGFPSSAIQFYLGEAWIYGAGWGIIVLSIPTIFFALKNPDRRLLIGVPWILSYSILLSLSSWRLVRWIIPLTAILPLLMTYGMTQWLKQSKPNHAVWIKVFGVVCLGWTFLQSLVTVMAMQRQDVRDTASHWIEENWPKASTIGFTVQPYIWDPTLFQSPYYHGLSDYVLIPLFMNHELLASKRPQYLSINDFDTGIFQMNPDRFRALPEARIYFDIFNKDLYREEIQFTKRVVFGKWDWFGKDARYPHDWRYPFPRITLLKRLIPHNPSKKSSNSFSD